MTNYSIPDLFEVGKKTGISIIIESHRMQRISCIHGDLKQPQIIIDNFPHFEIQCCFFRQQCSRNDVIELNLPEGYSLDSVPAGGWLLSPLADDHFCYWIPQPAVLRSLDLHERILKEQQILPSAVHIAPDSISLTFTNSTDLDLLDLTIWKIPSKNANIHIRTSSNCRMPLITSYTGNCMKIIRYGPTTGKFVPNWMLTHFMSF